MSSDQSPVDDTVVLERIIQDALEDGLAAFSEDFQELDLDVTDRESPNEKRPEEAIEEYLEDVRREQSEGTYTTHRSRLGFFGRWCTGNDGDDDAPRIEYLHELNGQDIRDFRDWRRKESGWEMTTEKHQMQTLRKFLRYCENPEWVSENLHKKVPVPRVDVEDESRDTIIRQHTVDDVLEYLERFEYATLAHCEWLVMGRTACRISGFLALDVCDYVPDDETGKAVLKFRNREDTGTRLKKGSGSERDVEVDEDVRQVIDDYLEHQRPDVTDEYGREPLFATKYGRPSASTIRKYAYMWSRPCTFTGTCPFDRDPSECAGTQTNDSASQCPDSVSPHPIRRGRITWHLNQGALPQMISEMYDVTPEIIKKHYDERSHSEKQQLTSMWMDMMRENMLNNLRDSV